MTGGYLPDEAATHALAAQAARALPTADAPLIVYLCGDLGAGKTSFARGLLQALGERGPVRSPTYGLVADYELPGGRVIHLDLYRLRDPEELEQLGLRDLLADTRLWLVEWPERGSGLLPPPDVELGLQVEGAGRRFSALPRSEAGRQWLAGFAAGPSS
ncbi:MAG: tRNA (adenosine(37)-N6)-threonylcarbamoyltransferase complex ATPase subunit type 1 TsaE [Steroidobacteraceae bacterium]